MMFKQFFFLSKHQVKQSLPPDRDIFMIKKKRNHKSVVSSGYFYLDTVIWLV